MAVSKHDRSWFPLVNVLAAVFLLSGCARATTQGDVAAATLGPQAPARVDPTAYRALLRRLEGFAGLPRGADSVGATDFAELRRVYAQSSDYSPYDSDVDLRNEMFGALQRSAFGEARRLADSALAGSYLDIFAHIGAATAAARLADTARSEFHRSMALGLMGAILASGEGTEASPWVVISVDEEYAVLQTQGLNRQMQSTGSCANGRRCDVLTAVDPQTGKTKALYFDITLPMGWLTRQLGSPPKPDAADTADASWSAVVSAALA